MTPADLSAIYGEGVLASYSGTCPVCSRFIAAGRSHIMPLAVALPPDPAAHTASRGNLIDGRGRPVRQIERAWIHAACIARVPEDLELARDERREQLAEMRRDSRVLPRRKAGRSR